MKRLLTKNDIFQSIPDCNNSFLEDCIIQFLKNNDNSEICINSKNEYLYSEKQIEEIKKNYNFKVILNSENFDPKRIREIPKNIYFDEINLLFNKTKDFYKKSQFKIDFYNEFLSSENLYLMSEAAKVLNLQYGDVKLYEKLRDGNILNNKNLPYQDYINSGYFVVRVENFKKHKKYITLVTAKGLVYISQFLKKYEK